MWRRILRNSAAYEQPNASSKKLILSVLNTTATRREVANYLEKYADDSNNPCYGLLFIRHLDQVGPKTFGRLSKTLGRLRMLGLRLICVVPPSTNVRNYAERLDDLLTRGSLKPLHVDFGLTKLRQGGYCSVLSPAAGLFNAITADTVPVIKPYVYDEEKATINPSKDTLLYMDRLCTNVGPYIDKFFILNKIGGTPCGERNLNAHIFIQLSLEFNDIQENILQQLYSTHERRPISGDLVERMNIHIHEDDINNLKQELEEHLEDIRIMNSVLSKFSRKSTGLITTIKSASLSADSKNPLLYNLLTDRSLISSSLHRFKGPPPGEQVTDFQSFDTDPHVHHSGEVEAIFETTVYKKGVDIKIFEYRTLTAENSVGLPQDILSKQLSEKLSDSPDGRKKVENVEKVNLVKLEEVLNRGFNKSLNLSHYLNRINGRIAAIIVIGDYEGIAILTFEGSGEETFVYLDKFTVLPELKGFLGISDIIFNLMFKKFPKRVVWRSRVGNVINKWYFQRSIAVIDLSVNLGGGDQKSSIFKLFYYDDSSDLDGHGDPKVLYENLNKLARHVRDIEPSWNDDKEGMSDTINLPPLR